MVNIRDKIRKQMVAAIADYRMIADGDRLLVAVSGGKDSRHHVDAAGRY